MSAKLQVNRTNRVLIITLAVLVVATVVAIVVTIINKKSSHTPEYYQNSFTSCVDEHDGDMEAAFVCLDDAISATDDPAEQARLHLDRYDYLQQSPEYSRTYKYQILRDALAADEILQTSHTAYMVYQYYEYHHDAENAEKYLRIIDERAAQEPTEEIGEEV